MKLTSYRKRTLSLNSKLKAQTRNFNNNVNVSTLNLETFKMPLS